METEKLLAIQVLRSVLKDGHYDAQVVWITSRKVTGKDNIHHFYLPANWGREIQEKSGGHVVVLKTVTGDLILLHPDTYEKVMDSIEAMIRKKKVKVRTPARKKESPLWPILRKFRGTWAAAKARSKRAKKKNKNKWLNQVTVGGGNGGKS